VTASRAEVALTDGDGQVALSTGVDDDDELLLQPPAPACSHIVKSSIVIH